MTDIRPMTLADVPGLHELPMRAFQGVDEAHGRPVTGWDERRAAWWERRTEHLLATDPGLQWVAVDGDEIVGVTEASMREGVWGLSLLAVKVGLQGAGLGRRLLDAAFAGWEGPGIICASDDPKALRRYGAAGFSISPVMTATGRPDLASYQADPRVREGLDREFGDAVDRAVRGSAHGPDHDFYAGQLGYGLRIDDGDRRGYAWVGGNGMVSMLAATEPSVASALLWAAFAREAEAGGGVIVAQVTGKQQWAVRAFVDAKLTMAFDGAVCYRGLTEPDAYLPSGVFL